MTRLAILATHPVQYYAPLFRELAGRIELEVFYAHKATPAQQAAAGFGTAFDWDVDLLSGYRHRFLQNVAENPSAGRFAGCDTPEIGDRLREGGFDAALSLGWHVKALLQGIWAARRQGRRVMVRGDSQLGRQPSRAKRVVKRAVYPGLLRVFDAALVVGTMNRAYFAHYGYPATRMYESPHAIDTAFFRERSGPQARAMLRQEVGIAADAPAALFAGKLIALKRPFDAVEAVARLRRSDPRTVLMIAGAGPLEEAVRQRAAALDVPLHCLGFVNQSRMPAVYAAADVLVLPSRLESWGLVVNEALACGRPAVVSDAAGCAPDLCDGTAGLAYPCGDVGALADALERLLTAPPPAEAIARRSEAHSLARAADGIVAAAEGRRA